MIRKILIGSVLLLAGIMNMQAQCSPNPNDKGEGLSPDSAVGFATGYVGQPYSQLVTINVPQDTVVAAGVPGIPFDSVALTSFTGLPSGFTYACHNTINSRCEWKGNTSGCMIITGNPTLADTGIHHLVYNAKAYLGGGLLTEPINLTYYFIKILPSTGIQELDMSHFDVAQNYPNPFSGKTEFRFSLPESGDVLLTVYNVLGKLVSVNHLKGFTGVNNFEFDRGNLAPGMYTYRFNYKQEVLSGRMAAE